jgi:ElaB/YqjD/DUF883 family membrane-anchored ribosome-binding protein
MKDNQHVTHSPKELITELQGLVAEAQGMMVESVSESSAEAMENLRERFAAAQERFLAVCDATKVKIVAGVKRADTRIRDNPYQSLAIALGVGVVVGVLATRRNN